MAHRSACLILVLCTLHSACGLYFHMSETERKCFLEEVPDETDVKVDYKMELYDPRSNGFIPSSPGIGMHVEVRDSNNKIILSRVYRSQGWLFFTAHAPGEHVICMYSNSTAWFSGAQLRVHLDIQVGEHAINYANVAQKEKLTTDQLRIRQLLDQVEQITKEQNYQRYREDRFRHTSESTNSRVLWWSLAQTVVLVCISTLQAFNLRNERLDLYRAFCKVLSGDEFTMFTSLDAFKALMEIIGTSPEAVTSSAISQWVDQVLDLDSSLTKPDEIMLVNLTQRLHDKVKEFAGKFLNNEKVSKENRDVIKPSYFLENSNSDLNIFLEQTKPDRSAHLSNDKFLLICECTECRPQSTIQI
ncbi:transmembrane emp24 domain-containing protein eca [Drosophila persimilis]|uniref:transmembrane emp24 domain-containing protein eca n=1 Tax=Drosophila persimilis TaxID=7234 RepID=UPI000F07C6D3|nr:transmembrane emp24 domain-containing protein eca [Drosophila persimilis]